MTDNLIGFEGRVVIVAGAAGGGIGTQVVSMAASRMYARREARCCRCVASWVDISK
jgi:uncharacterized protein YcfJ